WTIPNSPADPRASGVGAQVLGELHAVLVVRIHAAHAHRLDIPEPPVERARPVVAGARLEANDADARDERGAFEPLHQRAPDAVALAPRLDGEQQQVRVLGAVSHDRKAFDAALAAGDDHIRFGIVNEAQHACGLPAPAETVLDQVARHAGDALRIGGTREADASGRVHGLAASPRGFARPEWRTSLPCTT